MSEDKRTYRARQSARAFTDNSEEQFEETLEYVESEPQPEPEPTPEPVENKVVPKPKIYRCPQCHWKEKDKSKTGRCRNCAFVGEFEII